MEKSIEKRVLLLGIYTKAEDESIQDVLLKLEETGMFTLKEAKKFLKELKEEGYLEGSRLTLKGVERAKEIEQEFKL
jgi:polyhydroxyalkanoate synthesis regulator phasin